MPRVEIEKWTSLLCPDHRYRTAMVEFGKRPKAIAGGAWENSNVDCWVIHEDHGMIWGRSYKEAPGMLTVLFRPDPDDENAWVFQTVEEKLCLATSS